tara:strand:- start:35 stop:670 length:636 start_codon:yes stop_codon:yes gene_type:complete
MKVVETPRVVENVYSLLRGTLSKERTGFHLSDALYCNVKTVIRKEGRAPPITNEQVMNYWRGHAMQYYIHREEDKTYEIDGVTMTPDITDRFKCGLIEMKCTAGAEKFYPPEIDAHQIRQMMGYCKALDVFESTLLVVFFTKYPPYMKVRAWKYNFSMDEIDSNWNEILRRKKIIEDALEDKGLPTEVIKAFEPECGYCEVSVICPYKEEK